MPALRFKAQPRFGAFTPEKLAKYPVTLATWGAGAGVFAALLLSTVPLFKHDVLRKIPVVNSYFIDKTPDSDKPF